MPDRSGGGFQLAIVLGPKGLRNHDARAHGDAQEKGNQQVDNRTAGAHRGQGLAADVLPYHNGVHRVVKLLQDISQQQGD